MSLKKYKIRHKFESDYCVFFHISEENENGYVSFGDPKFLYKGLMLNITPETWCTIEHLREEWRYLVSRSHWQHEKDYETS